MAVTLALLKETNYKMHKLGGLRWNDMHTRFHEDTYVEGILGVFIGNLK
jgi:hypothetical protein